MILPGAIGSTVWKEQVMGFTMLGMISESVKKSFKSNLDDVAKMSVSGFASENPRVRYAALQSTGLLLNDLAPTFQTKYHQDLMPALLKLMTMETELKMQTQATAAMTSMIRGLIDEESAEDSEINVANKKLLVPYGDQVVQSIQVLFEKSIAAKYQPLQEEVLATLSCFASVLDTNFEAHYAKFMPGLKNILSTVKWETQQDQELRASCIEVIGFILTSVKNKPEICKQDAIEISQNIIETLVNGNLSDSDPQITAITNTISQICVCLKDDFKQFLPVIVPALLKDAQRDIDFKVKTADDLDIEEDEDQKGIQKLNLKVKGLEGNQQVSMNTNALEVKINAVQILKNLARNLEGAIFEFVEDISKVIIEKLLTDPFAMTIRKESAKCMRFLIGACKDKPDHQRALFIMTYTRLMEELEKRKTRNEYDQINGILKEIFKMLKQFHHFKKENKTVFSVVDATTLVTRLSEIVKSIVEDKATRMKQIKAMKGIDEEDMEYFWEDVQKVDKGIRYVMEINGCLLQNLGDAISPAIGQTLLPLFAVTLLNISERKDYELVVAVCMLCDCMEFGSEALFAQI